MAKNPHSNAGDLDLIPGPGTKIPQAMGQLSRCSETREASTQLKKAHMRQQIPSTAREGKKKKKKIGFLSYQN